MDPQSLASPPRRFFLLTLLAGVGALLMAAAAYPLLRYLWPRSGNDQGGTVAIPRDKSAVGAAHFFTYRGQPAVLLQLKANEFSAFSAVCTHLGCIVKWRPQEQDFLCPCHGGKFSAQGTVLSGPPPKPLPSLPVKLVNGQILIG